jgi:hypothetical protein
MVTDNSMKNSSAILNTFVKRDGVCKDVVHALNAMWMVGGGKTCIGCIFFRLVLEKSILYSHFVGSEYFEKVLTALVTSFDTVWPYRFFMLITMSDANSCINVTTKNNLGVGTDSAEHGVKHSTKLIVALVFTRKVGRDECHQKKFAFYTPSFGIE